MSARGIDGPATSPIRVTLAAAFVFIAIALGSLALWVVVPPLVFWGLSLVIDSGSGHYVAALVGVPVAMLAWVVLLSWLNDLYLRIRAHAGVATPLHWSGERPPASRGPLEPLLLTSLAIALVAIAYWFFVLAENPIVSV